MKILQINKYHYVRGGSDSVYFNTGKLLKEHGHEVIHFAMDYKENVPSEAGHLFAENKDFATQPLLKKIRNIPSFFYNKDAEVKLRELIRTEQPDIAHLHIFYGSLTSSIVKVLKEEGIPAVVSVHDYKFVCPSYLFMDGKNKICEACQGKNYIKAVQRKCVKGSRLFSTVFALEAYYRDQFFPLHKMFRKLIFVSKFSQDIHNKYKPEFKDISTHLYNFDPALEHKVHNDKKGAYFLYAGRLSKEKGLHTLIKAFAGLPGIMLKVAGTGDEMDSLQETATKNVSFLGFQNQEQLRDSITGASFIVVPSEWYENNPMAIIEAYSMGKPVIAAAIGGIPEIVAEGETGYLYTSGNVGALQEKILQAHALADTDYKQMSQKTLKYAYRHFNPETHYGELIKIYSEALRS